MKVRLLNLCNRYLLATLTSPGRISSIETSNLQIFSLLKHSNSKLLILDLQLKSQRLLSQINIMLGLLSTWPLNHWKKINILLRLISGHSELSFLRCSWVKLHGKPKTKKNLSEKYKMTKLMIYSTNLTSAQYLNSSWKKHLELIKTAEWILKNFQIFHSRVTTIS